MCGKRRLTKADAKKRAFIGYFWRSIKSGDRVALVGFGSFSVAKEVQEQVATLRQEKKLQFPQKLL